MPYLVTPEPTPNPNAMRFVFSADVLGDASVSFGSGAAAMGVPWAEALFATPGIASIFGMHHFVTITKDREADWAVIVPHAVEILQSARFRG